jgi:hypothetical protein
MHPIKTAMAGLMSLALLLGSSSAVLAQEEMEGPDPYLAGSFTGSLVGDTENPLGCAQIVAPDGTEFPLVTMTGLSWGTTTLLGATTMSSQNCYVPLDVLANIQDAVFTLTGEAGDEISGTWSGDCAPGFVFQPGETYRCYGIMEVTGGSGMFDGASGQIMMTAELWEAGMGDEGIGNPLPMEVRIEGLIEYRPASG